MAKTSPFYYLLFFALIGIVSYQTCSQRGLCNIQAKNLKEDINKVDVDGVGKTITLAKLSVDNFGNLLKFDLNYESQEPRRQSLISLTYLMGALTHGFISILLLVLLNEGIGLPTFINVLLTLAFVLHPFYYPDTIYNLVDKSDIIGVLTALTGFAIYLGTPKQSDGFFRIALATCLFWMSFQWQEITLLVVPLITLIDLLRTFRGLSFKTLVAWVARSIQIPGYIKLYAKYSPTIKSYILSVPYTSTSTPFKIPQLPAVSDVIEFTSTYTKPYMAQVNEVVSPYISQANDFAEPYIVHVNDYVKKYPLLNEFVGNLDPSLVTIVLTVMTILLVSAVFLRPRKNVISQRK